MAFYIIAIRRNNFTNPGRVSSAQERRLKYIDPQEANFITLRLACEEGDVETVKRMLQLDTPLVCGASCQNAFRLPADWIAAN